MCGEDNPKVFVLKRELSEVHLLLDNISANPETKLPATQAEVPAILGADWLKKICEIDWPPDSVADKAAEACLLIRAKDFLNTLAKPASGSTIAFTIMVTQPGKANSLDDGAPSRTDMAISAYPDLLARAESFRRVTWILSCVLVAWLLATCLLSWSVAYGNLNLQQLLIAQTAYEKAASEVESTETAKPASQNPPSTAAETSAAALPLRTAEEVCDQDGEAGHPGTATVYASVTQLQACDAWRAADQAQKYAQRSIPHWLGIRHPDDNYVAAANDRLSVLGTGVLPFCFGVLGAGAAIVRSLMRKIKSSSLSPRDLNMSLQQLALGAVTGACIGLFFAQPGANASSDAAALGPVGLSASALSFIAGFGVDAVFVTIESLIQRIFNIAPPAANAPGPATAMPVMPTTPVPAPVTPPPGGPPLRFRQAESQQGHPPE